MTFDFTQDLEEAVQFVQWLQENDDCGQPRMAVTLYSKHGEVDWDKARHFNLELLAFELHRAVELALKVQAHARLSRDLHDA